MRGADAQVQWVPEFLVDEIAPPPRDTPDAWIVGTYHLSDRITGVVLGEAEPVGPIEKGKHLAALLGEGVSFCAFRDFGTLEVTIRADGSFSADGHVEPSATHFCMPGDSDTLEFSLHRFVAAFLEGATLPHDLPEIVTVEQYRWDPPVTLYLVKSADGTPRFVGAAAAPTGNTAAAEATA